MLALLLLAAVPRAAEAGEVGSGSATGCDDSQPDDDSEPSSDIVAGEEIDEYLIDVELHEDGSATFTETITYDFGFTQRHGIYRDILVRQPCTHEHDRVYEFDLISVDSPSDAPDQVVVQETNPVVIDPLTFVNFWVDGKPFKRLRIGDPDRTINGEQTYEIVYRLDDVLNGFDEHDEFYWNVIGNGWGVPISDIDVTVRAPEPLTEASCFAGPSGSRASCTSAELVEGRAHYTQDRIGPHENVTVLARFPKGAVEAPAPRLEERWTLDGAFTVSGVTAGGAGILLLVIVGGFIVVAYRTGRDRQLAGSHVDVAFAPVGSDGAPVPLFADTHSPVEFVPPDDIRPGQVGLLIDEVVHPVEVTATIIDLAVRGYLRIDEVEKRWRKDDYQVTRLEKSEDGLHQYESLLLNKLVPAPGTTVLLSDLKDTWYQEFEMVVRAIYNDAMLRKWFHARPDKVRGRWKAIGWLVIILSLGLLAAAILWTKIAVLALPLMAGGLLLAIGSRWMPRRTAAGTGLLRRVRGFEEFIRDSEAVRARWAEDRNIFSEYLPYAIVFRCADKWARIFEDLGVEAQGTTDWYHGNQPFHPVYVSSSMSSFSSVASSSLSSAPSSSGSGGGGSSGGGGGGGGGGSW
jgi:hypothetical protein